MISKNTLLESNTRYAQGGIAVVSNFKEDSFEKHIEDTMIAEQENVTRMWLNLLLKKVMIASKS